MFSKKLSAASLFVLVILGCGGGGGSSASAPAQTPGSKLFVADANSPGIGSLANSNPSSGSMVVDRTIYGINTGLTMQMRGLALDAANDRLYVANGLSILEFNNASTASGNVAPTRVVVNGLGADSLFLDTVNDVLYVGAGAGVRVFNAASTATNASANRQIISSGTDSVQDVAVDLTKNILYTLDVFNGSTYGVNVFSNASTINGTVAPTHVINLSSPVYFCGLFLDEAHDRLYVSNATGHVQVFNNASTLNGAVSPDRDIILPVTAELKIKIDTVNDRLYALSNSALYIVNNVSTANSFTSAKQLTVSFYTTFLGLAVRP